MAFVLVGWHGPDPLNRDLLVTQMFDEFDNKCKFICANSEEERADWVASIVRRQQEVCVCVCVRESVCECECVCVCVCVLVSRFPPSFASLSASLSLLLSLSASLSLCFSLSLLLSLWT